MLFAGLMASANAQIYADIALSSGGSPLGTVRAELAHDKAPRTCANFVGLATGQRPWVDVTTNQVVIDTPYYDGLILHRLIHDFVIQGGSSNGLGTAGPGYVIQDEFHPDLRHSGRYFLSMAKADLPGTGNAQFFITLEAASFLDDKHSVFGEVTTGKSIIDDFTNPALFPTDRSQAGAGPNDPGYSDTPLTTITIDSITISGPSLAGFDIHDPALELPTFGDASPIPVRDAAAATFATQFARHSRHDYLYSYSLDLATWSPFPGGGNILSYDTDLNYAFTVTGLTLDRFFASIADIDYSFLQNPSIDLLGAGSTITITANSGVSLSVTPNGAGGGTWSDSTGNSGNLVSFSAVDGAPATGAFRDSVTKAHLIPLLQIDFELDSLGGPDASTGYNIVLDFREPDSGRCDGFAWNLSPALDGIGFLHAFAITPAP